VTAHTKLPGGARAPSDLAPITEAVRRHDVMVGRLDGRPECTGCGWSCDDAELDLCWHCFNTISLKAALRGEHGADEQREARETMRLARA
jgi:hypothetical protein